MLAARSIEVRYETERAWAMKFGQQAAKRIRAQASTWGDKWYLDEVVITIKGRSTGYGGQWIKTAMFWMCSYKADATPRLQRGSCASY